MASSGRRWRVAVRADSSAVLGHGHAMRCLALAAVLRRRDAEVTFLHRPRAGDASAALLAAGVAVRAVQPGPGGEVDDAAACVAALGSASAGGVDWMVLDHYGLGAAWVDRVVAAGAARRVLVVDDLADRPLAGELLLDPNWHAAPADRYRGRWPRIDEPASLLFGTGFALLRPEFAARRRTLALRDGRVDRIVVAFGGGDPDDATGASVAALRAGCPAVSLDVLVGTGSPHGAALRARWAGDRHVSVTVGATDVADRFARADLFVGAGGSMTWERACLGLPGITLPIADNQREGCARLAAAGEGLDLGRYGADAVGRLVPAVRALAADPARLVAMGSALAGRSDGLGAERVADAMLPA